MTHPSQLAAALTAMDEDSFVGRLGPVADHSSWVARELWRRRPFTGADDLHAGLEAVIRAAAPGRQLELLRAHPELAGREAGRGRLTAQSSGEQRAAGLDRLSAAELGALRSLNRAYRHRFGFPFIVCVRRHTAASILDWGRVRLAHTAEREREVALGEVVKIARLRLDDLLESGA